MDGPEFSVLMLGSARCNYLECRPGPARSNFRPARLVVCRQFLVKKNKFENVIFSGGATPGHARSNDLVKKQMTWPLTWP